MKKKNEKTIEILKQPEIMGVDDLSIIRGGARSKDCTFTCNDYCGTDCTCNNFTLDATIWF